MKVHEDQLSLFSMGTVDSNPSVEKRAAITKLIRKRDERRVVVAALERLRPEEEYWKEQEQQWRGVSNFKYPANKYAAMEARGTVRFLKNAHSTIDNLTVEIEALEKLLGIDE